MKKPENAMEIFRLLEQSNCRECGEKTCLAFAGAVFQGRRTLDECPRLDEETAKAYTGESGGGNRIEQARDDYLEELKAEAARTDLEAAAKRIGGEYRNGRLTVRIMGKNFSVDENGKLSADIHVNPWVAVPFFAYALHGKGRKPTGKWLSFRELENGAERYPLFRKRCEEAMKRVADIYPELFDDMVHLFGGKRIEDETFQSDVAVVLHPFPRVPVMICYWKPDDGMESTLNVFFDEAANDNMDIGALFSLGAGLTQMFEKLAMRHGVS
jgi:hypothetical protein